MKSAVDSDRVARLTDGYSLEMTAKDVEALNSAAYRIPKGTTISVTFLPGEHAETRLTAAQRIKELGFMPMPHFSARRIGSEQHFIDYLASLQREVGHRKAFVVGGDPAEALGPYPDALSLIRTGLLARHGIQLVGIAGYPEGHPDISEQRLWAALRDKHAAAIEMGHEVEIVTQFGFDADPVLAWLERVRERGIAAPVRVGVPGPASIKTLMRFAARCGVGASAKVMSKYGLSLMNLLKSAGPDTLLAELAERLDPALHGAVMIHFYPFGGLASTADYAGKLREVAA